MRIILLRHGQYRKAPAETLTTLGRRQARRAGKRLREYGVTAIHASTMPRAIETAGIVKRELGFRGKVPEHAALRECVPGFPRALRREAGFTDTRRLARDLRQAEAAFRRFVARRGRGTALLVCHGNLIRYLVCRAIGADPLCWVNMDIHQCGLTVLEWSPRTGRLELISHNDVGHLPPGERTFI